MWAGLGFGAGRAWEECDSVCFVGSPEDMAFCTSANTIACRASRGQLLPPGTDSVSSGRRGKNQQPGYLAFTGHSHSEDNHVF